MRFGFTVIVMVAALVGAAQRAHADDDANKAQFVTSCGVCHAVERGAPARQGPNLLGVYGRKTAAVDGFAYSAALKSADWVWDEDRLNQWIENAQTMRPGAIMNYRQADPAKRAKVIAYLKTLSVEK